MKKGDEMPQCSLLDIEMPVGKKCPSPNNTDNELCFMGCGWSSDTKGWLKYWINYKG